MVTALDLANGVVVTPGTDLTNVINGDTAQRIFTITDSRLDGAIFGVVPTSTNNPGLEGVTVTDSTFLNTQFIGTTGVLFNLAINSSEDLTFNGSTFTNVTFINDSDRFNPTTIQLADSRFINTVWNNVDARGAFLEAADFSGAALTNVQFNPFDLNNGNAPTITSLNRANLSGTTISNSDFQQVNLNAVDFSNAAITNSNFQAADLKEAYGGLTVVNGALTVRTDGVFANDTIFQGVNLEGAVFEKTRWVDTLFDNSSLTNLGAVSDATFTETVFNNADFTGTTWIGNSAFDNVRFTGTLTGFDATGLDTRNIDFSGVTQFNNVTGVPGVPATIV